jgi:hypothetical protein
MTAGSQEISLYLVDDTIDAEALAERAYRLKRELIEAGAHPVTPVPLGQPPSGSKAADPIAVGALILSLANSPSLIAAIAGTVQSWMNRTATQRIRIKVGEKELEVAGPISAADEELIRDVIRRYFEPESGSTGEL